MREVLYTWVWDHKGQQKRTESLFSCNLGASRRDINHTKQFSQHLPISCTQALVLHMLSSPDSKLLGFLRFYPLYPLPCQSLINLFLKEILLALKFLSIPSSVAFIRTLSHHLLCCSEPLFWGKSGPQEIMKGLAVYLCAEILFIPASLLLLVFFFPQL